MKYIIWHHILLNKHLIFGDFKLNVGIHWNKLVLHDRYVSKYKGFSFQSGLDPKVLHAQIQIKCFITFRTV